MGSSVDGTNTHSVTVNADGTIIWNISSISFREAHTHCHNHAGLRYDPPTYVTALSRGLSLIRRPEKSVVHIF
jgi:hypothetical protein